jgi:hypothetical protein
MQQVVAEIRGLMAAVERESDQLGIDTTRTCVWSGSAGVPFGFVAALDQPSVRAEPDHEIRSLAELPALTRRSGRVGAPRLKRRPVLRWRKFSTETQRRTLSSSVTEDADTLGP